VSDQKTNTYIVHTVFIAIAIVIALVVFLRAQWTGH
jgi:hypothetical protein